MTHAAEDVGPIALAPNGDLWFTTSSAVFRLPHGGHAAEGSPPGSTAPHGIAVARGRRRARRGHRAEPRPARRSEDRRVTHADEGRRARAASTSPATGRSTSSRPTAHRVARFSAKGKRLGFVGGRFGDPYAVASRPDHGLRRRHERHGHDRTRRPRRRGDDDLRLSSAGCVRETQRSKLATKEAPSWRRSSTRTSRSSTTTGRRPSATSTSRSRTAS